MILASEYNTSTGIFTGARQAVESATLLPTPALGCAWLQTGWYDPQKFAVSTTSGLVIARSATPAAAVTLADAIATKLDELAASARGIRSRGVALAAYGITIPTDEASLARLAVAAQAAMLGTSPTVSLNLDGQWISIAATDVATVYQLACAYCQQVAEQEFSAASVIAAAATVAAAQAVDASVTRIQWPLPTVQYTPKAGRPAPSKKTTIPVRAGRV